MLIYFNTNLLQFISKYCNIFLIWNNRYELGRFTEPCDRQPGPKIEAIHLPNLSKPKQFFGNFIFCAFSLREIICVFFVWFLKEEKKAEEEIEIWSVREYFVLKLCSHALLPAAMTYFNLKTISGFEIWMSNRSGID